MKCSLLVPTYKRHVDIVRLLDAIKNQTIQFDQVVIVVGPNDIESTIIVEKYVNVLKNLQILESPKPSFVVALNIGLNAVTGDIVCFTDDDAAPVANWLESIKSFYAKDDMLGAVGGRDIIIDPTCPELGNSPMADTVGCFNFFGNLAGNHHRGCLRSPCLIHVLKGVNMSFRRSCLKNFKFDEKLVYYGAEVGTEIDLCCSIRRGGFNVLYSNEIVVIHHTSHRPAGDGRRDLYGDAAARRLWNLGYLARKWLPAWQLPLYFAYFSLRGARVYPGVLMAIILLPILGPKVIPRLRFSLKYQIMGLLKA